jgi:nucleoside-diphosphate-sugar epimerase
MRYLVTGGAGFIGSNTVDELVRRGHDVVEANLLACEAKAAAGLAINVGTGNRYTLNKTLALLEKITGRPAKARYVAPRDGDIRDSQADIARARNVLGYNPRVGFEEGLSHTWEWFLHQTGRTEPDK